MSLCAGGPLLCCLPLYIFGRLCSAEGMWAASPTWLTAHLTGDAGQHPFSFCRPAQLDCDSGQWSKEMPEASWSPGTWAAEFPHYICQVVLVKASHGPAEVHGAECRQYFWMGGAAESSCKVKRMERNGRNLHPYYSLLPEPSGLGGAILATWKAPASFLSS